MTTLYITKLPASPGRQVVYAIRTACQALGIPSVGWTEASNILSTIAGRKRPYMLGSSDDPEAIKAARLALAEAGVTCAENLPPQALVEAPKPQPQPEAQPQVVSYTAAQFALVAMKLSHGDPSAALHHCVLMAHTAGETIEDPRTFHEAAAVLLDTFPPTLLKAVRDVIYKYADLSDLKEESPDA